MAGQYRFNVLWGVTMNPNYDQVITIYNCFRAADNPESKKDTWQKTVLHNCFYKSVIGRTVYAEKNLRMDSTYTVRIPVSAHYLPYREWIRLPKEERKEYFTCNQNDIVIRGECGAEITDSTPNTASQVLSRYKPDSFVVTAFSHNTSHQRAKHYRLGG